MTVAYLYNLPNKKYECIKCSYKIFFDKKSYIIDRIQFTLNNYKSIVFLKDDSIHYSFYLQNNGFTKEYSSKLIGNIKNYILPYDAFFKKITATYPEFAIKHMLL